RIAARRFDDFAIVAPGRVALDVVAFRDVALDVAADELRALGADVVGRVRSLNTLVAEVPVASIPRLVGLRDTIEFVAQAGPALSACNDQVRSTLGVPVLEGAPYDLDGSGVIALVFDQGLVSSTHTDLAGRVTAIESGGVSLHATHVGGTLG